MAYEAGSAEAKARGKKIVQSRLANKLEAWHEKPFPGLEKFVLPHVTTDGVARAMDVREKLAKLLLARHLLEARYRFDPRLIRDNAAALDEHNKLCFGINTLTDE